MNINNRNFVFKKKTIFHFLNLILNECERKKGVVFFKQNLVDLVSVEID